jgi:hypothetical protein
MKKHLLAVLLLLLPISSTAEPDKEPLDVQEWLIGCVGLSNGNIAMSMDINCVALAVDYCTMGRLVPQRSACTTDLVSFFVSRSNIILAGLPDIPPNVSTVKTRLYQSRLERLRTNEVDGACLPPEVSVNGTPGICHIAEAGLRWIEARSLARVAIEQNNEVINP